MGRNSRKRKALKSNKKELDYHSKHGSAKNSEVQVFNSQSDNAPGHTTVQYKGHHNQKNTKSFRQMKVTR